MRVLLLPYETRAPDLLDIRAGTSHYRRPGAAPILVVSSPDTSQNPNRMNRPFLASVWDQLRDHTAFRAGTLYAGVSWFLVEALDTLGASPGPIRQVALVLAAGFLILTFGVWRLLRRRFRAHAAEPAIAAPVRPAGRTRRFRWAAAVVVFCALASGMWGFRTHLSGNSVPAAATHMAVLPFHATGSAEARELGIGMVDLLTAALSDVGGIHTIPGRTVLARIRSDYGDADVAIDNTLELGRRLGAGSVLTGSITAFGSQVRLTAEIRSVGGLQLAAASAEGAQDNVLQLTDELVLGLLRELWRTRAPMPTVRVAGLTTTSPAALKAYLRGEEFMRAVQFDSAGEQFQRAVELDSTFALAWLRLAENAGWAGLEESVEQRRDYARRALRFADRLPERERSFARALNLAQIGSFEAFDSLDAYVRRHPDDPMGWFELGDVRFHSMYLGRFERADIIQPFLESTRLDPTLGIGLHHVLDIHIATGDSAAFNAALQQFAPVAPRDRVERFERQAGIRWAPAAEVLPAFTRAIRGLHPVERRLDIGSMVGVLGKRARLDLDVDPSVYYVGMDSLRAIHGGDRYWLGRATTLRRLNFASIGRADSAFAELEREIRVQPSTPLPLEPRVFRALFRTWLGLESGFPHDAVTADVRVLEESGSRHPAVVNNLYNYHVRSGDRQRAARYLVPPQLPPNLRAVDTVAVRVGFEAWTRLLQGDTVGALPGLEESLRGLGFEDANYIGLPWHDYAIVLTRVPERRPQGIRMLRYRIENLTVQTDLAYLALARALEAEGDRAGARLAYAQLQRMWTGADAFRRADLDEVTRALIRLAGEGS
jgi:TolB-like protein